jgi:hypothetical protein
MAVEGGMAGGTVDQRGLQASIGMFDSDKILYLQSIPPPSAHIGVQRLFPVEDGSDLIPKFPLVPYDILRLLLGEFDNLPTYVRYRFLS